MNQEKELAPEVNGFFGMLDSEGDAVLHSLDNIEAITISKEYGSISISRFGDSPEWGMITIPKDKAADFINALSKYRATQIIR